MKRVAAIAVLASLGVAAFLLWPGEEKSLETPESPPPRFEPVEVRATGAQGRGLGLGLYIVSEVARAHGAVCSAQSSAAATVFSIEWPRIPFEDTPNRPV